LEEAASGCEKLISFVRHRGPKEETARLSITVPAGVKNGQRLKLRGEGDAAQGKPGDLYVIVNFQEHPLFRRKDNDLLLEMPLSFVDAILGTQVEIPTLNGKASLKVPPGTHNGQLFRLKGKGFPEVGGYGFGDMLVKAVIEIPKEVSAAEKTAIEQLRPLSEKCPQVTEFKDKVQQVLRMRK
jgi:molecular chaperone DnaJ